VANIFRDRVRETSTTTGTGDFTLDGAVTGYQSFSTAYGGSAAVYYTIVLQGGAEWETGIGAFVSPSTLTRGYVRASSNGGAAVNFSSGTKDVWVDVGAEIFNAPAFSAKASANQTAVSTVAEFVEFPTEIFDSGGCFNNTNATVGGIPAQAFLPTTPGYYQINAVVRATGNTMTLINAFIYKNGSIYSQGNFWRGSTSGASTASINEVVQFNGTSDYIQIYGEITASSSPAFSYTDAARTSAFSAAFLRVA
jgi:hypothetical protein